MRAHLAATAMALFTGHAAAQSVTTYHNGLNRHGEYTVAGLTAATAANMHRDTTFDGTVSGDMYAQPLYWKPSGATTGQVIVATESNVVEALDDTTGKVTWQTQLPAAAPLSALQCGNINPEGVTGTPAIDPASGTIYLDAVTNVAPAGVRHMVYAISAATGQVLPDWPVDVQASLTAAGVAFDSTIQGERGAVLVLNGNIYIAYGGRSGDCGNYHGVVVQLKAAKHAVVASWLTRASKGGIWAQGGTASDGASIFATTGNTSGASSWGDGEGIIRLRNGLAHSTSAADYFTPSNWQALDSSDEDLGGTEALPLHVPVPGGSPAQRIIAFGKDGNAYLADRGNLGGVGGSLAVTSVSSTRIITAPAIYNTKSASMVVFRNGAGKTCTGSSLSMLSISSGATPISETWCAALNGAGAPIVTTTNGEANPLVWVTGAEGDNELHGFNAMTGQVVFAGTGTAMTGLRHFGTILAANGRLYVAGDNKIYAFAFQ
jgi:hypothetical protein